mmetsp:Transcript_37835/g.100076  ORF Transcript_37835/g.100076 Transcript_37835/m.100076 type:complete len:295 (+) Transcript_37835:17-901(+)
MGCGASTRAAAPATSAEAPLSQPSEPAPTEAAPSAPVPTVAMSPHVTVILYDFKDKADGDAWYAHFLSDADDGWLVTAAAPGMQVCKLYKAEGSDTKYGWYEEWDQLESQISYTKHRFSTGFLTKWLGLDVTLQPPSFTKLKDVEEKGIAVEQAVLVKTTAVQAAPVALRTYCVNTKLTFKEQSDCDAFLAGFAESEDGFKATAEAAGCCLLKLFKAGNSSDRWMPSTNWTTSFAGLYEEWESKEAYEVHRAARNEIISCWLGESGSKLKDGKPVVEEFIMGISSNMGKSDLAT